jgi:hypothetical protein
LLRAEGREGSSPGRFTARGGRQGRREGMKDGGKKGEGGGEEGDEDGARGREIRVKRIEDGHGRQRQTRLDIRRTRVGIAFSHTEK